MTQIGVSYLVIILYVSTVVTFTLLVGLLPVYVNPPECKPDEINAANQIGEVERTSKLSECIEFTTPEVGIEEPWFNPRLPTNIQPLEYEIEINALSKIYDGKLSVKLVLTDQTDTFIVHKRLNSVQVEAMFDKDNVEIPIACYGEYPKNDYYIFKTVNYIRPEQSPLDIRFGFSGSLEVYESGLFDIEFGNEPDIKSLTVSKFEPLNARKAYPCFDEPNLKATYKFTINHANDSIVLSNTEQESEESINGTIRTYFKQTPKLPTYLLSLVIFNQADFQFKQDVTESNIQVNIWARTELIDAGFLDEPLVMAIRLINTLEKLLPEIASDLPRKIDIFASPLYPSDGIGHWGLPIFSEEKIIFNNNSAGERIIQDVALLMAEKLAEFFFGNYVTFSWWDELWLQEALSDYLKYRMVDEAYPEWNIVNFCDFKDELIDVLIEDGYPSSHPVVKQVNSPYEIEEYFDRVERSKVAAVLRMIEDETSKSRMLTALQTYLEANAWGNGNSILFFSQLGMIRDWRVTDFVDRWFKQSNYPLLTVSTRQIAGNRWIVSFNQKRALNLNNSTSILYPSPYDWRWYIPVTCLFGKDSQVDKFLYNISESDQSSLIGDGNTEYDWFHCGYKFLGYFSAIYPKSNWDALKVALSNDINILEPSDRANLLHNIFMNAMTNHSSYFDLVDFLSILSGEQDYLPWRTIHKHFNEIGPILEYKRSFYQLSSYFTNILSNFFVNYDQSNQTHVKRLLWESNYELQCKLENSMFIRNASDFWYSNMQAILELTDPTTNMIDPLLRGVVYKYHLQNTYDVDEWFLALQVYRSYRDFTEKRRIFEALAFTRVPGLLAEYFFNSNDEMMDIFERIGHVSKNVYGRYLTWTYYRTNYEKLVSEFGLDEPRLGQALIDISYTFESDEMLFQLTDFIEKTVPGATKNARVKALERVTANLIWLELKESEIFEAFHLGNRTTRTNFL